MRSRYKSFDQTRTALGPPLPFPLLSAFLRSRIAYIGQNVWREFRVGCCTAAARLKSQPVKALRRLVALLFHSLAHSRSQSLSSPIFPLTPTYSLYFILFVTPNLSLERRSWRRTAVCG
jgi:hypothetical protein